ncbi:MAG: 50S ribosomal protein L10 [Actinobacteria bacterium]|nr:50S ribosomal protein L10 [Actinomycetota bacterium]
MNREEKETRVAELVARIKSSGAMLVADYRGLTVAESRQLRQGLREAGCTSFEVVKNTLTKRAAEEAGAGELKEFLTGPTAIAFCDDEAVSPAKVLVKFAKELKPLEIKGGMLDNQLIDVDKIKFLASLPPKDVLQAQLLGVMIGPIRGLATVCAGPIRGLVTVLQRIQEQKEAA